MIDIPNPPPLLGPPPAPAPEATVVPAEPPPKPPRKGVNKSVLMSLVLLLLVTLPLSVKLISDQRQLVDLRKKAMVAESGGGGRMSLEEFEQVGQGLPNAPDQWYSIGPDEAPPPQSTYDIDYSKGPDEPRGPGARKRNELDQPSSQSPSPALSPDDRAGDQQAPCSCNIEKNIYEGSGCGSRLGQTCGIEIVDRRSTSLTIYCNSDRIRFCETNYSKCAPDSSGGHCEGFEPPASTNQSTTSTTTTKKTGYCDRSSPNTNECTDKNEGASCTINGGGGGTCRVIMSDGANAECACVASGPPPPGGGPIGGGPGGGGPSGGGPSAQAPPPSAPQCQNIKIYKSGQVVTPSTLKAGDEVKLAAVAPTSATKARFRVNGGSWQETTAKTNNEYTLDFTIPTGVTNFTIEAQLFINGNWQ